MRRKKLYIIALSACVLLVLETGGLAQAPAVRTTYHVKQIASGVAYLDGGSNDGLAEGMRLKVSRLVPGQPVSSAKAIADLAVVAVATISAVCDIQNADVPVQAGDTAELSQEDAQTLQMTQSSKTARHVGWWPRPKRRSRRLARTAQS